MGLMDENREARYGYFDAFTDLMRKISEEEVRECMKFFEEAEAYEYLSGCELAIKDFNLRLEEMKLKLENE